MNIPSRLNVEFIGLSESEKGEFVRSHCHSWDVFSEKGLCGFNGWEFVFSLIFVVFVGQSTVWVLRRICLSADFEKGPVHFMTRLELSQGDENK